MGIITKFTENSEVDNLPFIPDGHPDSGMLGRKNG